MSVRWRCAVCHCVYFPDDTEVVVKPYPSCPNCDEEEDVFEADDGQWPAKCAGLEWEWNGKRRWNCKACGGVHVRGEAIKGCILR